MERRQGVLVVSLHDVLLSVRLQDVWNKSQMKHPMKSRWYVLKKENKKKTKKHLKKVLDMLQVANKETQSLLLIFNRFHILF